MSDYLGDSELNELIQKINAGEAPATTGISPDREPGEKLDALRPGDVGEDEPIARWLGEMVRRSASDLLLVPGAPPSFRVAGSLVSAERPPLEAHEVQSMLGRYLGAPLQAKIDTEGAADFSIKLSPLTNSGEGAVRFRVNVHRQRGALAAAVRALPAKVPSLSQLHLPEGLSELVKPSRGLVLICGPTGSGKTSTLAALVGEINRTRAHHIVTIEDPIEYEHTNARSLIEQIEVGRDTPSFAAALRSSLRQDPDVILVGEMRDLETVSTALTAAETGHLILSTLHTSDAAQAIHRIVDVFPSAQQSQIYKQLALSLHAIVSQQLVPRIDGAGRAPALELLLANQAVRNHIRTERLQNLPSEVTLGKRQGMISLEDSLANLVQRGMISPEEARARSLNPGETGGSAKRPS